MRERFYLKVHRRALATPDENVSVKQKLGLDTPRPECDKPPRERGEVRSLRAVYVSNEEFKTRCPPEREEGCCLFKSGAQRDVGEPRM